MSKRNWILLLVVGLFQVSQSYAAKEVHTFKTQMDFDQWRSGRLINLLGTVFELQAWIEGSEVRVSVGKAADKIIASFGSSASETPIMTQQGYFDISAYNLDGALCIRERTLMPGGGLQITDECISRICPKDFSGYCGYQYHQQQQQQRQQRQQQQSRQQRTPPQQTQQQRQQRGP